MKQQNCLDLSAIRKNSWIFILIISLILGCSNNQQTEEKKTLSDFGIRASNLFFYYKDLDRATKFYTEMLGLQLVGDYGMAKILRVAPSSYLILVDAVEGMHTAEEPKTVAIALITDQLDEWYTYLVEQGLEMRGTYKPTAGKPHDGFVALDPEGYLLEFERFNPHQENEKFIPILDKCETVFPQLEQETTVPSGLGFKSMVTWLYYKDLVGMQRFYEDVLGLEMIVDQGWTKIYQVSSSGFIGLVDEKRGMHSFTEQKGVTVSFIIDEIEDWFAYVQKHQPFELRSKKLGKESDNKYAAFVGYDPEGYFMEFDKFYQHELNTLFYKYLNEAK
jgi:catechol 2,3-dioxygenase-like lactoylglutathione lyase family enzyme